MSLVKKLCQRQNKIMKRATIILISILALAYLILMPALARSERRAGVINAKSTLLSMRFAPNDTVSKFKKYVFNCTNLYIINDTVYQSQLAVDHWDYQSENNLLILTTNNVFLYVTQKGTNVLNGYPSGY
jgi:hypothetical protein